jgi:hypothetical protein
MRHIIADVSDVPAPFPVVDRRRTPDRRKVWRGGRRDSDWVNRPLSAWGAFETRRQKPGLLRRAVSVLHLW